MRGCTAKERKGAGEAHTEKFLGQSKRAKVEGLKKKVYVEKLPHPMEQTLELK